MDDSNFGFQALDGLVSIDRAWWRVYGGAGYVAYMNGDGTSGLVHGGAELRGRPLAGVFRPVAGVDVAALQARSWGASTAALVGFEYVSPGGTRRVRLVLVFDTGFSPYGQISLQQRSRAIGTQFHIEL
jgi:hypothetical protein